MVEMLVPSLSGDLRTVTSTMVRYGVAAKEVFKLIMDLLQGTGMIYLFYDYSDLLLQWHISDGFKLLQNLN